MPMPAPAQRRLRPAPTGAWPHARSGVWLRLPGRGGFLPRACGLPAAARSDLFARFALRPGPLASISARACGLVPRARASRTKRGRGLPALLRSGDRSTTPVEERGGRDAPRRFRPGRRSRRGLGSGCCRTGCDGSAGGPQAPLAGAGGAAGEAGAASRGACASPGPDRPALDLLDHDRRLNAHGEKRLAHEGPLQPAASATRFWLGRRSELYRGILRFTHSSSIPGQRPLISPHRIERPGPHAS